MELRRPQAVRDVLSTLVGNILGAPALHFAAAGALLFFAGPAFEDDAQGPGGPAGISRDIVIDATRIRGLRRDYGLANKQIAGEAETRALVDSLVSEEILFREGIARGFEQDDRSIGWRLVQKMRYLGEDNGDDPGIVYHRALKMGLHLSDPIVRRILVEKVRLIIGRAAPKPSEQELADWYAAHRDEYAQAGRVSLRQLFFDRGRRGDDGAREAAAAAAVRAEGHGLEVERSLGGDPFVMGSRLAAQGRNDLTKLFGPGFADEALALPQGVWSKPVESPYGWHLLWIDERIDARVPGLSEVRSRVEKSYESGKREQRVEAFLADARTRYTVRIDEAAIREAANG